MCGRVNFLRWCVINALTVTLTGSNYSLFLAMDLLNRSGSGAVPLLPVLPNAFDRMFAGPGARVTDDRLSRPGPVKRGSAVVSLPADRHDRGREKRVAVSPQETEAVNDSASSSASASALPRVDNSVAPEAPHADRAIIGSEVAFGFGWITEHELLTRIRKLHELRKEAAAYLTALSDGGFYAAPSDVPPASGAVHDATIWSFQTRIWEAESVVIQRGVMLGSRSRG